MSRPTSSRSLCFPPARMHFCVSATRGGFHAGFCCPRKIGTNWFMPALVKSRFGASGRSDDDGTMVCFFSRKKSRNDCRICAEVINPKLSATFHGMRELLQLHSDAAAAACPKSQQCHVSSETYLSLGMFSWGDGIKQRENSLVR